MDATELAFAGADAQVELLRAREVSARELVEVYLARIARLDPGLNAYRVVREEQALAEADAVQARIDDGDDAPLLGVPIAIKDDQDVAGELTTMGTLAQDRVKQADGRMVARLREAGAIVLGKTQVPAGMHSPYTESMAFGATRNPWDVRRTPGGSSGGSGAAVAAGLCALASGSDGAGSIRIPSTWCGLFGLKPQRGRVSTGPYVEPWQDLSHNGPMTRRVADAARFLDATTESPAPPGGFAGAAGAAPGRLRIAVSTALPPGVIAPLGRAQRRAVEETRELLASLGHDVVARDPEYPPETTSSAGLRMLRGIAESTDDLDHPDDVEPRLRKLAQIGRALPNGLVGWTRRREAVVCGALDRLFADVDVLITPACLRGPYWIGDQFGYGAARWLSVALLRVAYFQAFNVTGQPACVVPAGSDDDGLPLAVQLVSRPSDEATLLSLAAQLEAERPWAGRRPVLAA